MTAAPRVSFFAPVTIVVLFAMIAGSFIMTGTMRGRGAQDDVEFHFRAIEGFIGEWPAMDFADYASATTPGYHAVLATAGQITDARWWLRAVGALFTVGWLWTLARSLSHRVGTACAIACTLPVLCSMYVVDAGVYLLPDNAGWWGVLGIMLLTLDARFGFRSLVVSSLVLFALVWCRQIHIWAAAMIWAAAWLGPTVDNDAPKTVVGVPIDDVRGRLARLGAAMLGSVPAFVVLGSFYVLWGSRLSPPQFEELHTEGLSFSTPAFFLSILGIASVFFVGWWLPGVRRAWARSPRGVVVLIALAGVCGLLLGVLPETTYDIESGRFSGIWNAAKAFPVFAGRTSVLIVVFSTFGAMTLAAWGIALPARVRLVSLVPVLGFVAAQIANPQVWQRYHEPFVLILVAVMASHTTQTTGETSAISRLERHLRIVGPIALALLLGAITVIKLVTSQAVSV